MLNDTQIISAIKEGKNEDILRSLYREVLPDVKRFINNNGGNNTYAEDCFQEAVIALIISVKEGRFKSNNSIAAYIKAIVRYKWYDQFKDKLKEEAAALVQYEDEHYPLPQLNEVQKSTIKSLLSSLGELCEQLIRLSVFEGLSQAEIAIQLGKASEDVVKTSIYRCRKKLKEKVQSSPEILSQLQY